MADKTIRINLEPVERYKGPYGNWVAMLALDVTLRPSAEGLRVQLIPVAPDGKPRYDYRFEIGAHKLEDLIQALCVLQEEAAK